MATQKFTRETITKWEKKFSALVKDYGKTRSLAPHFGTDNGKTHAVNEGTLPLVTCDKCAMSNGGCAHSCYALRVCFRSKEAMEYYARNTVIRRKNPLQYYRQAFAAAFAAGALLRLNESGDFENIGQFEAACLAAKEFKTVKCIGYTHRREIAAWNRSAPKNMIIRYSTWTDCENLAWAKENHIPFAAVAADPKTVKGVCACPSQARKAENEKRMTEGLDPLPEWSCAACAAAGIGCANVKKNVCFKLH